MWKNEKDNDREKRRVRGRKRREREIERRKKSARKREENKTPHASCFCGWAFDCNLFRSMDGSDYRISGIQRTGQELCDLQDRCCL